jgi:hypothetical protein
LYFTFSHIRRAAPMRGASQLDGKQDMLNGPRIQRLQARRPAGT